MTGIWAIDHHYEVGYSGAFRLRETMTMDEVLLGEWRISVKHGRYSPVLLGKRMAPADAL